MTGGSSLEIKGPSDILDEQHKVFDILLLATAISSTRILPVEIDAIIALVAHKLDQPLDELGPIARGSRNVVPQWLRYGLVVAKGPAADGQPDLKSGRLLLEVDELGVGGTGDAGHAVDGERAGLNVVEGDVEMGDLAYGDPVGLAFGTFVFSW